MWEVDRAWKDLALLLRTCCALATSSPDLVQVPYCGVRQSLIVMKFLAVPQLSACHDEKFQVLDLRSMNVISRSAFVVLPHFSVIIFTGFALNLRRHNAGES